MALKVRYGCKKDTKQIEKMLRSAHNESPRYKRFVYDAEAASNILSSFLIPQTPESDRASIVCEDTDTGTITGFIGLMVQKHLWCDGTYAIDIVQYIRPAHRGGSTFLRLADTAEKWAMSKNVDELMIGVSSGYKAEKIVGLYKRMGYRAGVHSAIKDFTI